MAKFCTKCGKPLEDGKPCDCEKENKKEEAKEIKEETTEESSVDVGAALNNCVNILIGMFKNPSKTLAKKANKNNFTLAIVSIIVNTIVFGLTVHFLYSNIFGHEGYDLSFVESQLEIFTKIFGLGSITSNQGLNAGIFMIIMSLIIIGGLYIMHTGIYKKAIDSKKIVGVVGISELFFSLGLIVTIIVSFISPIVALIVFLLVALCFCVHIHQGMLEISDISSDKIVYTVSVSLAIPVLAFLTTFATMLLIEIGFLLG